LAHVVELVLPETQHEVHAAEADEVVEVRVEEPPGQDEEHRRQRVEQQRREVERQLLSRDGEDAHDAFSRRTSCRKMSSRSSVSLRSSRTSQPPRAMRSPASRGRSTSPPASSTNAPFVCSTSVTSGNARSAAATSAGGPSARSTTRWRRPSCTPSSV